MPNVYDILKERGLIAQTTHEQEIRELLGKEKISFYIGFDPVSYTHLNTRNTSRSAIMIVSVIPSQVIRRKPH